MDDTTKQALSDIATDLADARADLEALGNQLDRIGTAVSGLIDADPTDPPGPIPPMIVHGQALDSDTVAITWDGVAGADGYTVGRDGTDRAGYGSWATTTDTTTWSFENLRAGTAYRFSVGAYRGLESLSEGSVTITTPADPVVTPPTTSKGLPLVGRSKLGTNAVLFKSGVDDLNGLANWETTNGVKVDGLMRFVPRLTADQFLAPSFWDQMGQIAATGRIVVIAMPWAPESAGATMNAQVAAGTWDSFHKQVAGRILQYGLNRPNVVLRVAWEYNSTGGNGWYLWSTVNGGVSTFKAAWSRTRANFRAAGVDKVFWDQCANKGPQSNNQVTGADVYVDAEIVGIDHYAMWPSQTTAASFASAVNQVPGMASQKALAVLKGVQWSLDECGPANPAGANLGGDSAAYASGMVAYLKGSTPPPALFTIYDDGGAPSTFDHTLARNPNWKAAILGWLKAAQK